MDAESGDDDKDSLNEELNQDWGLHWIKEEQCRVQQIVVIKAVSMGWSKVD